jgi:hypothetical protein
LHLSAAGVLVSDQDIVPATTEVVQDNQAMNVVEVKSEKL